ncbi:MAG: hypothetical protein JW806_07285 [Sedimentisphaerales bacterium]|nr:hypothetical protein [Sedimentisphaerales bacterium]
MYRKLTIISLATLFLAAAAFAGYNYSPRPMDFGSCQVKEGCGSCEKCTCKDCACGKDCKCENCDCKDKCGKDCKCEKCGCKEGTCKSKCGKDKGCKK